MLSLAGRKWYAAASVLILGAITAQILAKHHAGRGMMAMARAQAAPWERAQFHRAGFWHAHRADLWGLISLGFAVLAVGCWLVSRRRRELGPQAVLLILHC